MANFISIARQERAFYFVARFFDNESEVRIVAAFYFVRWCVRICEQNISDDHLGSRKENEISFQTNGFGFNALTFAIDEKRLAFFKKIDF